MPYKVEGKESDEAGVLGFEPRIADPKSAALPLGHTPTLFVTSRARFLPRTQV